MRHFYELFLRDLRNAYNFEKQLIAALPELAKNASTSKLKEAFREHLRETKEQFKRLELIGKELHEDLSGHTCEPIHAMIQDCRKISRAKCDKVVKDAALIACVQKIEHYEIACYGSLKAYAKQFHFDNIESLLEESSKEEGHANKTLVSLAEGTLFSIGINWEAHEKTA